METPSIFYILHRIKTTVRGTAISLLLLGFSSCKDFLDAGTPHDRMVAEDVFSTPETATSAVLGIYSQMMGTSLWYSSGGITVFTGLSADEFFNTNATDASYNELRTNSLTAQNALMDFNIWDRAYKNIYQANICIEKLRGASQLPAHIREQLLGEAIFIRAFIYFYLVGIFGDAPLILSTDYEANSLKGRDEAERIYNQIIRDLGEAKGLLKDTYVTADRVRPNRKTAQALLARVYLYREQWDLAIAESTEVMESGFYAVDSLQKVFTIGSRETIWQLMPVQPSWNTTEARALLPISSSAASLGQMALTPDLYNSFTAGDLRKSLYILSKTVAGTTYRFAYKYRAVAIGSVTEYYKLFRLSELLLIRSEAYARKNDIPKALLDLNILRKRAGLEEITKAMSTDIFPLIEKERRHELFAEWGHRWFDLKRTGRAVSVLRVKQSDIQETDLLYPIPNTVLTTNSLIKQNKGYE